MLQNPGVDFGDVSERVALRNRLKCKSFRWYLQHVYPEMRIYNNTITYGEVRALTHPELNTCHVSVKRDEALSSSSSQLGGGVPD